MNIIAQDKSYNAGHSTFTLFEINTGLYPVVGMPSLKIYKLCHNCCILWEGESKEEGMVEYNKITKAAW